MKVDFGRVVVNGRAPALDAFRGCFVFLMFSAHVARFARRGSATLPARLWDFVSWFEPAISAGFLLVVGVSLAVSRARAEKRGIAWRAWYRRLLLRAATLYVLAVVLFVSQYGFEFPDALFGPDILSVIALALLTAGAACRAGAAGLVTLIAVVLVSVGLVEWEGGAYAGVNAGPGGALPLIAFTPLGMLLAGWPRRFTTLFGGTLVAQGLGFALPGAWVSEVQSTYASGVVTFWNHTLKGALLLGLPLLATAWSFQRYVGPWTNVSSAWLRSLGRHALLAYLVHLVILEGTRRAGVFPLPALGALVYLICLVLAVRGVLVLAQTRSSSSWLNRIGDLLGVRF